MRLAGERIDLGDALDLVAPQLDAHALLLVGREDLDRVAAHAEGAALERDVVALVLDARRDPRESRRVPVLCPISTRDHQLAVRLRIAQAVDRRDRRDDDDVVALHAGSTSRAAAARSMSSLIDASFSMYVSVVRDVRFGLVVVVVRDEVLDRVVREERLELSVQLRRQRLVVRQDERRPAVGGDDVGHRHRLARPGDAEQGLDNGRPAPVRRVRLAIALGWSPAGLKRRFEIESAWQKANDRRQGFGRCRGQVWAWSADVDVPARDLGDAFHPAHRAMIFFRCVRFSTSTSSCAVHARRRAVVSSSVRMLVPVSLTAVAMSA